MKSLQDLEKRFLVTTGCFFLISIIRHLLDTICHFYFFIAFYAIFLSNRITPEHSVSPISPQRTYFVLQTHMMSCHRTFFYKK